MDSSPSLYRRLIPVALTAIGVFGPVPSHAADLGPNVRAHVQVPLQMAAPAKTALNQIEAYGKAPAWSQTFTIPYQTIQTEVNKRLKQLVPKTFKGKETCTDPCPDVEWELKVTPSFTFTQTNQPTVHAVGRSSAATVEVRYATQARINLAIKAHAETWSDEVNKDIPIVVVLGLKAKLRMKLWPKIEKKAFQVELSLVQSNVGIELNGVGAALGAKWGALTGISPLGVAAGGPVAVGLFGAILGDAAAEAAEKKIRSIADKKAAELLSKANAELQSMASQYLDQKINQAQDIRDEALNTKLPGVNKSLSQLMSSFGSSIQLHTTTPSNKSLRASAVLRTTAANAGRKLRIEARIPKRRCTYLKGKGPLSGMVVPLGLVTFNANLEGKIGQSCSAVFGPAQIDVQAYLGANPRDALGPSAQKLATWKSVSPSKWVGPLKQTRAWYTCQLEVPFLPKAAILRLKGNFPFNKAIGDYKVDERVLFYAPGSRAMVFNAALRPLTGRTSPAMTVGGGGECKSGSKGGRPLTPHKAKEFVDLLDPTKCPQCGLVLERGKTNIYVIENMSAFVRNPKGKLLKAKLDALKTL